MPRWILYFPLYRLDTSPAGKCVIEISVLYVSSSAFIYSLDEPSKTFTAAITDAPGVKTESLVCYCFKGTIFFGYCRTHYHPIYHTKGWLATKKHFPFSGSSLSLRSLISIKLFDYFRKKIYNRHNLNTCQECGSFHPALIIFAINLTANPGSFFNNSELLSSIIFAMSMYFMSLPDSAIYSSC